MEWNPHGHIFYVNLGMDMFIYKDDIFEFWNSTDSWEWAAFNSDLRLEVWMIISKLQ